MALRAAQELLAEHGWSAVTHVAVAARSGIGRSTLYRHWPDAVALLHDAIAARVSRVREEPTGDLRADLRRELNALRRMLHEPVTERGLRAIIERTGVDPGISRLGQALYRSGSGSLRAIIAAAKSRGELPAGLDPELAIDQLAGPLIFRRLLAGRRSDADHVDAIIDAFLAIHPATAHPTTG